MFDLTPTLETGRRIGRFEQTCADIDKLMVLMTPLCKHLMPLAVLDMKRAVPEEGKTVELDRKKWKSQYKEGVNRCMGYDILWV